MKNKKFDGLIIVSDMDGTCQQKSTTAESAMPMP